MASSSQSSARSPSISPSGTREPGPSFLTTDWQRFALDPETKFDIVGRFREHEDVKWARKAIQEATSHATPPAGVSPLPPQVCPFILQNLKFDTDQPGVLFSEIDGREFQVTM
jgi:hypothetical protein